MFNERFILNVTWRNILNFIKIDAHNIYLYLKVNKERRIMYVWEIYKNNQILKISVNIKLYYMSKNIFTFPTNSLFRQDIASMRKEINFSNHISGAVLNFETIIYKIVSRRIQLINFLFLQI